jgi:hypothetical protein
MPLFPSVLGPGTWRDGSGWPHREDSLTDVDSIIWVVTLFFFIFLSSTLSMSDCEYFWNSVLAHCT